DVWKAIDKIFKDVLNGNPLPSEEVTELVRCLGKHLEATDIRHVLVERIDVELKLDPDSILDLPCTSGPLGDPPKLSALRTNLSDNLRVRLGQISSANDWNALRD